MARSGASNCARASRRSSADPIAAALGGGPGRLVITAPQPGSETFAANGPSFSVTVSYEIGECDPAGSVK